MVENLGKQAILKIFSGKQVLLKVISLEFNYLKTPHISPILAHKQAIVVNILGPFQAIYQMIMPTRLEYF